MSMCYPSHLLDLMQPRIAASHWGITGKIEPLDTGHINSSYIVDDDGLCYFLQRVNRNVFKRPESVMRNLEIALSVLQELAVKPIQDKEGKKYWLDENRDLWRIYPYVEHRSFSILPYDLLWEAGNMYGRVLSRLRTVDIAPEIVIEDFHRMDKYLREFDEQITDGNLSEEVAFIEIQRNNLIDAKTEFQVIHGDCKTNNLLFDPSVLKATHVVDLDTIMLGDPIWDFGDLLRSTTIGGEESISASVDVGRLGKVIEGFFSAYQPITLDKQVVLSYVRSPAYMSFMLGVRFLTDFLNGNRYFKVDYSDQNLNRARSQFELVTMFQSKEDQLRAIIGECATALEC